MPTPVERVTPYDVVNWMKVARGHVRVIVARLGGASSVAVVSLADLERLEHGERFEAATEPPNDQDRCLECGQPRIVAGWYRMPTEGCSMCQASVPSQTGCVGRGRRWRVNGAWR